MKTHFSHVYAGRIKDMPQEMRELFWTPIANCDGDESAMLQAARNFLRAHKAANKGKRFVFSVLIRESLDLKTAEGRRVHSWELVAEL